MVLDSTVLLLFLFPGAGVPLADDGTPVKHATERITHLITRLEKARTKVVIPTPVLSEVLVRADDAKVAQIMGILTRSSAFRIEPFDTRAALEVARMTHEEKLTGRKPKKGKQTKAETVAKLKYDRQIVATALVTRCTTIYSDDGDLADLAKRKGLEAFGVGDLAVPDDAGVLDLFSDGGDDTGD